LSDLAPKATVDEACVQVGHALSFDDCTTSHVVVAKAERTDLDTSSVGEKQLRDPRISLMYIRSNPHRRHVGSVGLDDVRLPGAFVTAKAP